MPPLDARLLPVDTVSAKNLAAAGLTYDLVDLSDDEVDRSYQRAVARGFLGGEPSVDSVTFSRETFASRRNTAVRDPASADPDFPVATVNSWVAPLTTPGGGSIDMWSISVVTVAATHRRRGIARALLEGELRTAAAAGVPMAGLTVTEATIYGRYGFGAAVPVSRFEIDTRRAGWGASSPAGFLQYRERADLADDLAFVHERARLSRPGQVPAWRARLEGFAGLSPADADRDKVRGVRYVDAGGIVRGALVYTLSEKNDGRSAMNVRMLVADSAEATAALWRFAIQHDLVDQVVADLRPSDDPLPWLVADQRGVTQTVHDHGWLRILDVPAALSARQYSGPVELVLRVDDDLGFAAGDWRLVVDADGAASVTSVNDVGIDVTLGVAALSSLYVGGVRASTLGAAGLITAASDAVERIDRAFSSFPAPSLDIWY